MLKDCLPKEQYREECPKCRRAKKHCLCSYIRPFNPPFRFVILMSVAEYKYQRTGSGLLAHLTLQNSEIITGNDFTDDKKINAIINDSNAAKLILYPGKNALTFAKLAAAQATACGKSERIASDSSASNDDLTDSLSDNTNLRQLKAALEGKMPLYIFVIDGTWRGARSMMFHSQNLKKLQCISFEHSYLSNFRIKRQPEKHCVSTIESIYYLLKEAEENGIIPQCGEKEALLDIFNRMVEIQLGYSRQHHHRREDNPKVREKLLRKEELRKKNRAK